MHFGARWMPLAVAAVFPACGDTEARPLYAAPASVQAREPGPDAPGGVPGDASDARGTARPCTTDQNLVLGTSTPSSVARPGTVYSAPPLSQYWPRPITVRLTTATGAAVPGCDVTWVPGPGSGWVFPIAERTDADGRVDAWWTAGPDPSQTVQANVITADGGAVSTTLSGVAEAKRTESLRIYLDYAVDAYDSFSVEVVPVFVPSDSSLGVLWTPECGVSFANDFSADGGVFQPSVNAFCWDSNRDSATIVDAATSSCAFDGSGMYCSRPYAWKLGGTYRIDLSTKRTVTAHTDYAFFVTDVATGVETKLTELRYGGGNRPSSAYSYLKGFKDAPSCLFTAPVAARFGHVKKVDGATAADVKTASLSTAFDVDKERICANYTFGASENAFLLSTGGETVGPPVVPGGQAPTITLP